MALIDTEVTNQALTIRFNRPEKRNAFNPELVQEILQALEQARDRADINCVCFEGRGEHFCAGADIAHMQSVATMSPADNLADAGRIAKLMQTIAEFPLPTLAIAQGATMGGGLGILAACDIAVAESNAYFAFSEIKLGIAPSTISPYIVRAIGRRAASYYFFTGDKFDAPTAQQLGLIHRILDADSREAYKLTLTQQLANYARPALLAIKQLLQQIAPAADSQTVQATITHLAQLRGSATAQEGLQAFLQKRTPVWPKE